MDNLFFLEAKCIRTKDNFYIRFDKAAGGVWCQSYGVKYVPQGSTGSFTNKMSFSLSNVTVGPQYKCPHCGNTSYIKCGSCGKIACFNYGDKVFKCPHCDSEGEVSYDKFIEEIDGKMGTGQG